MGREGRALLPDGERNVRRDPEGVKGPAPEPSGRWVEGRGYPRPVRSGSRGFYPNAPIHPLGGPRADRPGRSRRHGHPGEPALAGL